MTWVQINERILELEQFGTLTDEQVQEWNTLVTSKIAGILKRNEKDLRETKAKIKRT